MPRNETYTAEMIECAKSLDGKAARFGIVPTKRNLVILGTPYDGDDLDTARKMCRKRVKQILKSIAPSDDADASSDEAPAAAPAPVVEEAPAEAEAEAEAAEEAPANAGAGVADDEEAAEPIPHDEWCEHLNLRKSDGSFYFRDIGVSACAIYHDITGLVITDAHQLDAHEAAIAKICAHLQVVRDEAYAEGEADGEAKAAPAAPVRTSTEGKFVPVEGRKYKYAIDLNNKVKPAPLAPPSEDDKINKRRAYQRERYRTIFAKKQAEERKAKALTDAAKAAALLAPVDA